jgi:hypothetical protein
MIVILPNSEQIRGTVICYAVLGAQCYLAVRRPSTASLPLVVNRTSLHFERFTAIPLSIDNSNWKSNLLKSKFFIYTIDKKIPITPEKFKHDLLLPLIHRIIKRFINIKKRIMPKKYLQLS